MQIFPVKAAYLQSVQGKLLQEKKKRFHYLEFAFRERYGTMVIEYVCPQAGWQGRYNFGG